jgi:BirA family biotin operon repressor/biotin-[acetyl-CoA-carboxylase] ligase
MHPFGALNIPLLDRLRAARGEYLPLEVLGPDPDRVRNDLEALAAFGFAIERDPARGACYLGPAERLCPDQIEHALATSRIGRRVAVWSRVTSTNDVAARASGSVSNDGLVILAEEQTAGRGRPGHTWIAPPRSSILMSVLLFPPAALDTPGPDGQAFGWLTALGAVATAEVVSAWIGREAAIKWPNDVRVEGRKIAGILVERPNRQAAVIGIGLNVNRPRDHLPDDLTSRATWIELEGDGFPADRSEVARALIRRLDHWYEAVRSQGVTALNAPWRDRYELLGQVVRVSTPSGPCSGRLVDLDLRHGLTLADAGSPRGLRLRLADVLTIEPMAPP